jgi:hypothetical protein
MRGGSLSSWAVTNTISQPAACTRIEPIPVAIERPQLAVPPGAVVLHRDLVLWESQVGAGKPTAAVLDPVLRHGAQTVEYKPHPDPRFRSRLRPWVGKLDGATSQRDAFV